MDFRVNIDKTAAKILNIQPSFFANIVKRYATMVTEERKRLILDQFVQYPTKSKTKVISRSGRLKRSIKTSFKIKKNQVILYATYDPRYQTVQPFDNAPYVTINANEKEHLAIPNQARSELFDEQGSYKFKGIDLVNPRHPFGIESKRLKRKGTVLLRVRGSIRGQIFYFLKRSITIKTKRPIYEADKKLKRKNQKILNKAFEEIFKETFL